MAEGLKNGVDAHDSAADHHEGKPLAARRVFQHMTPVLAIRPVTRISCASAHEELSNFLETLLIQPDSIRKLPKTPEIPPN